MRFCHGHTADCNRCTGKGPAGREVGFSRELRMLAAVKLYELGRLSSGRAAELAGMTRVELLLSLNRYRVFPLASELEDLEEAHSG